MTMWLNSSQSDIRYLWAKTFKKLTLLSLLFSLQGNDRALRHGRVSRKKELGLWTSAFRRTTCDQNILWEWEINFYCIWVIVYFDILVLLGLLQWSRNCLQCRRCRFDPWVKKIPCRRACQPTPVFLPGEFHGQRSLMGYSPWGCKESDMIKILST